MTRRPALRVGVLLSDWTAPRWVAGVIERIQASSLAQIVLTVRGASPPPRPEAAEEGARHLLYRAYTKLDDLVFRRRAAEDVLGPTEVASLLAGVPVVDAALAPAGDAWTLDDTSLATIASHRLDVVLRLDFPPLAGASLDLARHGVWSYDHGAEQDLDGFWEVLEAHPTTLSTLRLSDRDGERVIYRSWSATDHHSVARSRQNRYAKSADLVLRKLRELRDEGRLQPSEPAPAEPAPHAGEPPPENRRLAGLLLRLGARFARDKWTQARHGEQWVLAFDISPPGRELVTPDRLRYLIPPADRFWADPFPVENPDGDGWTIFFEEFLHERRRGRIARILLSPDGTRSPAQPVLEGDSHFSYPCVFRWKGEWLMVPETGARRTVELYHAKRFPDEWERCGTPLAGVRAADTTITEIEGRWWMFTCMAAEGALASDELFLFHAESPFGPWTPHRRNPVKSDVRSARPAGQLFFSDGAWHRPAQDCAGRYGRATVVNRIDRLTPDEYGESVVQRIEPGWDARIVGTHTFNRAGRLTVIDALRLR